MEFSIVKCPKCKGNGEHLPVPLPLDESKAAYIKCVRCAGTGAVPYIEVLAADILAELKILNGKKR